MVKKVNISLAILLFSGSIFAQNPDQSVINLWLKKDLKFDSPKPEIRCFQVIMLIQLF